MSAPTRQEAQQLGKWRHDYRSGADVTPYLAKNPYNEAFIEDMFPESLLKDPEVPWPVGFAAKWGESLSLATQALLLERVPAPCFLSQDSFPFKIFLDVGVDFPQEYVHCAHLRSNSNRSCFAYHRLSSLTKPIRRLRLELELPFHFIKFKSIRLTIYTLSSPRPQLLHLEKEMEWTGTSQMMPGVLLCSSSTLTGTYSFQEKDIYSIEIRFDCVPFIKKE